MSINAQLDFRFLPPPHPACPSYFTVGTAHAQLCLFAGRADSRSFRGAESVTMTASGFPVCSWSACVLAPLYPSHLLGGGAVGPKCPSVRELLHHKCYKLGRELKKTILFVSRGFGSSDRALAITDLLHWPICQNLAGPPPQF